MPLKKVSKKVTEQGFLPKYVLLFTAPSLLSLNGSIDKFISNKTPHFSYTMPSDADISRFKAWLTGNGAKMGKIDWPSVDTIEGCRGAQATSTIETNEIMMEIPIKLMMRVDLAFEEPQIGRLLSSSQDLLRGDVLLCVYIMCECLKGDKSFYAPYIAILPSPGSIVQWEDSELDTLQDPNLIHKAKNRRIMLRNTYRRSVVALSERFPEDIDLSKYTYELFLFAWFCIQARAFGRRLPWTAMVPFADCLNHSNVQTKYDYDVNGNGLFRMYPTGSNCYPAGSEVLNSYGRRPNDNLLLDYGFSMLYNMWDSVEVMLALHREEEEYSRKSRLLLSMGKQTMGHSNIERLGFPFDALLFVRVVTFSENDLDVVAERIARLRELSEETVNIQDAEGEGQARSSVRFDGQRSQSSRGVSVADIRIAAGTVVSLESELKAVRMLKERLLSMRKDWLTTMKEDEEALEAFSTAEKESQADGSGDTDDNLWKAKSSVVYRLTRKKIVEVNIARLDLLTGYLEQLMAGSSNTVSPSELSEHLMELSAVKQDKRCNLVGAGNESPYHSTAGTTRMGVFNKEEDQGIRLRAYITRLSRAPAP